MKRVIIGLLFFTVASATYGNVDTGFEAPDYVGSATGTLLAGQQGWYVPVAGSAEYNVFTYAGNTHGIVQNPLGDEQFVAGRHEGDLAFGRAQLDHDWSAEDLWYTEYDVAVAWTGDFNLA
ncbi:MAG: hypothetical protein KJ749_01695, partial [Planctomycetes bacterium]|nr:hypothetical protein [Planctomycetota bacterium]